MLLGYAKNIVCYQHQNEYRSLNNISNTDTNKKQKTKNKNKTKKTKLLINHSKPSNTTTIKPPKSCLFCVYIAQKLTKHDAEIKYNQKFTTTKNKPNHPHKIYIY